MDEENVHIITYSNNKEKLKNLKRSEKLFSVNVDYIVKRKWEGYVTKLKEMKERIKNLNDTDIVIFIDAWDVIITSDKSEMVSKFKSSMM